MKKKMQEKPGKKSGKMSDSKSMSPTKKSRWAETSSDMIQKPGKGSSSGEKVGRKKRLEGKPL